MVRKLLDVVQNEYKCKKVDIGVFDTVKAEGSTFHTESYNAEGLGRVTLIEMTGFLKLWRAQSFFVTPLDKDAPIFYYHRHGRKGNDVLKIEIINTFLKRVPLEELDAVQEKYAEVTEVEDKEEWYDEMKLPQSTVKRVKKEEGALLDAVTEDYFTAYMKEVAKSKECERSQKKQKVEKLVKGLAEQSGMAITQFFLSYYDHNVTAKLCTDVLFGIRP